MLGPVTELILLAVYLATLAASPLVAVGTLRLSGERSTTAALGTVLGGLAGLLTLSVTVVAALVTVPAAAVLALAGIASLVGVVAVPLLVGRDLIHARRPVDRGGALRWSVLGLPAALSAGVVLVVVATGPLAGTVWRWPVWLLWVVTTLSGPGAMGALFVTLAPGS
ncbi:hypothetical protein GJ629_13595 [Halapricum sp. CBA1109]|uniref:hypothetical protein n=1 Tax=Halapricum sp. CBA1109 TaxID=2668068 RepID=UPI0012F7129F|nr:hypothetical protein [Halapricum sp. CBA1109]MUV90808.1 hypothetical protein [Halapricum sp. CBA1109]